MKCELCHKNDAHAVLHRQDEDGELEEVFVCKSCAAAHPNGKLPPAGSAGSPETPKPDAGTPEFDPSVFKTTNEEPPEFVKNFFEAAVGLVEGIVGDKKKQRRKCPTCGATWESIQKNGRLGCPDCWKTFPGPIRDAFLRTQYGPRHVGKTPAQVDDPAALRAVLERELKKAVKAQQFEKADELRRRIDALPPGEEPPRKK